MASINKVIIVGNLGKDPEVRYIPNGQAVANFTVATNESWTNKTNGQREERTEWHRIVAWGKLAEFCKGYLNKGKQVYIEGRIQTRQWEDKEGNSRWTTEVIAQTLQLLGRAPQGSGEEIPTNLPGSALNENAPGIGNAPSTDDNEVPF